MQKRTKKKVSQNVPTSSIPNADGALHATGRARFISDEAPNGRLFAVKVFASPHARARIVRVDISEVAACPGVEGVFLAKDIPGENQVGHIVHDDPLLADGEVQYVGQPVAIVVAENDKLAKNAVRRIRATWRVLKPCLTIDDALRQKSLLAPERRIERGNVDAAMQNADAIIEGEVESGSQAHCALETHICRAYPGEGGTMTLYSATQSTSEVQEVAAHVLGISRKDVTVDVKRLGGGFGGKESGATRWACLAALGAAKTGKAVELRLTREEDLRWAGKRHPYKSRYRIGFTRDGRITAYDVELNANGGATTDLSLAILERSMLHADNAYYIPNVRITGRACRTNLAPNTAFRGFGAPQGIFVIEQALGRVAKACKLDPFTVRMRNAYREGQRTPYGQAVHDASTLELLTRLRSSVGYDVLRKDIDVFNASHALARRGIGIVPVKFGISFTSSFLNQGSALVWVYADGSISLSHGGVEMGQEVNTKVARVVSQTLGISAERIRVESANTSRVGNASPMAASTGSDINGHAARNAALELLGRLKIVASRVLSERSGKAVKPGNVVFANDVVYDPRKPELSVPFFEVTARAYFDRVDLGAHGFYKTPGVHFDRTKGRGNPFHYFVFGAALVVAEADMRTGMSRMVRAHIVHETGQSLNPEIDRGQIEGAFLQGVGWSTMEQCLYDADGKALCGSFSTYKIPTIRDLPEELIVEMVDRERSHASVLGSKAVGEPPLVYGQAAYFAIKDAVESLAEHRKDSFLEMPATSEAVCTAAERMRRVVLAKK